MSYTLSTFDFIHSGKTYRAEISFDDYAYTPWEHCSLYQFFQETDKNPWTGNIDKRPGQVVINTGRGRNDLVFLFDVQAYQRAEKRQGSTRRCAAEAAASYLKSWRDWCENRWHYVVVGVTALDENSEESGETKYLGGVDYYYDDSGYVLEAARDLAAEIESNKEIKERKARRAAEIEAAEALAYAD
jgi:hypothetical protein